MAVNTCEMWSNGIKIAFFSKTYKNRPAAGSLPQTPIATGGWELHPQIPVCDTFKYTNFLNTSPKLDIFAF